MKSDFQVGKKFQMPSFRDCLKERKTVQMLTVSREVAIEVQVYYLSLKIITYEILIGLCHLSLFTSCIKTISKIMMDLLFYFTCFDGLLVLFLQSLASVIGSSCFGSIMCKSLILFHDLLVATTLSPV